MAKTVLVIRATGSQGKAIVKHLAKSGWKVHAFVSDPSSERALALKKFGDNVSLHKGTLDDSTSLEAAMRSCDAVFLTQMPSWTDDSEIKDAQALLNIAKAQGIKHIVLSTQMGLSAPNVTDIFSHPIIAPAVTGKIAVEKLVRESGIPWTLLRPGWFNTNITLPVVDIQYPGLSSGKLDVSFQPDWVIPAVDPEDIGAFTAMAFNNPEKSIEKSIVIFSEALTVENMFRQIEEVSGKKIELYYRTEEEVQAAMNDPYSIAQTLMKELQPLIDIDEMKSYGVPLTSFRQFLENNKDSVVPK